MDPVPQAGIKSSLTSFNPVTDDFLGSWDASTLLNGSYTIKLVVVDSNLNEFIERRVVDLRNVTISFTPPLNLSVFRLGDTIFFNGTITGTNFQSYEIEYGEGTSPDTWRTTGITLVNGGLQPVIDNAIGYWDTGILAIEGAYTLRILVYYNSSLLYTEEYPVHLDPLIQPGWPKSFYNVGPVTVGYLGDGTDGKIIVSTDTLSETPSQTYVWDSEGTEASGWPAPYATDHFAISATGDVDGDGKNELVMGYSWNSNEVTIFHHDGTLMANWPLTCETAYIYEGIPVISDIDNDGDLEVFVGGGKLYAWHHDGSPVSGWPKEMAGTSPAIADINGDGDLEIIVASMDELYVFDPSGAILPGFPVTLEDVTSHPPIIGDVDNDGTPEIILAVTEAQKIYVFKNDGTVMTGWPQDYYGYPPSYGIALGDITGDGYLEIFLASVSKVYAWDYLGNTLPQWPVYLPVYWLRGSAAPVLGDINGDGNVELIIGVEIFMDDYDKVYAYTAGGTVVSGWPKLLRSITGYGILSSPSLADLDNDGDIEIAVSSNANHEMQTDVYVWDFPMPTITEKSSGGCLHTIPGDWILR